MSAAHGARRLALAAAVTIGAGAIAAGSAESQQQVDPCVLTLEGFTGSTNPGAPGCVYSRSVGPESDNIVLGVSVFTYDTEEEARRNFAMALDTHFTDGRNRMQRVEGLGDEGAEVVWSDVTTDVTGIYRGAVRRTCRLALVNYTSGGRVQGTVRLEGQVGAQLAREVDRQLRALPCPGGAAPVESIGVRLSCQRSGADTTRATCLALPQGTEPGSTLRYTWRVDGRSRRGGDTLDLADLAPGPHEIEVVLTDEGRGLTSEPQRVRLELGAAPETPGTVQPLPADLDPDRQSDLLTPAAVAGLGLLALGVTGAVLRNRRSRAVGAPAVRPEEPATTRPPAASRPTTLPERPSARPRPIEAVAEEALEILRRADDPVASGTPPPAPSIDDTPRDIWLEADRVSVPLKGDAKDVASVTIVARKLVNGVVTPAAGEVTLRWTTGDPQRLSVVLEGADRLRMKALLVGTRPLAVQVAVAGTHRSGAPVRGVLLTVTVDPVRATVRVIARKDGFADTEIVEVLPGMARAVAGRFLTYVVEPWSEYDNRPAPLVFPLAEARCEVSVRIDDGPWSRAGSARTDAHGRLRAPLPAWPGELGAVADVHELADSGRVTLDPGVEAEWRRYFEELPRIPEVGAFSLAQVRCDAYPRAWVRRIAEAPERDMPYARAALNLLRVAIVFVAKGRGDFMDQRRDLGVRIGDDLLGSIVDVFTDVVEVAAALYDWGVRGQAFELVFKRKGAAPVVWRLPTLRQILLAVAAYKVGWLLLQIAEPFLDLLKSAQEKVNATLCDLLARVPAVLDELTSGRLAPGGLERILKRPGPLGPMPAPSDDVVERLLATSADLGQLARDAMEAVLRSLVACLTVLLHVALLLVASVLKKVVPEFVSGIAGAAGEAIEEYYIGPAVSSLYEAGGQAADALAGWMGSARKPERLGLAGLFIDAVADREAYDRRLAAALDEACDRCERFDVTHDWVGALRPVREAEVRMMAEWQTTAEWERVADLTIATLKVVVKVVQTMMFAIGSVGSLAAGWWRQVAASREEAPEPADIAGAVETAVDLGILAERFVVVAVHASRLAGLSAWSAARIHGLFAKGRPA